MLPLIQLALAACAPLSEGPPAPRPRVTGADARPADAAPTPAAAPSPPADAVRVASVYDGDTFTLESGEKVRLQWVNTPERSPKEPFAMEAQRLTERLVTAGPIELVHRGGDQSDKYGRTLSGVRTVEGDLAEALLRAGLAHVFLFPPPPDHAEHLLAVERQARRERRGIWSTPAYRGPFHITSFHANAPGDDTQNVNGERMRLCNVSGAPVNLAGFVLQDRSGDAHVLPPLTVPPGYTVVVYSGRGQANADPRRQLTVYLGSEVPLWNNREETVILLDPSGQRVDERHHHGSSD